MSILDILEAHKPVSIRYRSEDVVIRCACGTDLSGEVTPEAENAHRVHIAQALEPHMQEQVSHERAHTIQMIRDQSTWNRDETDEHGQVTLDGYLTIGTRELEKIEAGAGADRMCFSLTGWEKREEQVRAEATEKMDPASARTESAF